MIRYDEEEKAREKPKMAEKIAREGRGHVTSIIDLTPVDAATPRDPTRMGLYEYFKRLTTFQRHIYAYIYV